MAVTSEEGGGMESNHDTEEEADSRQHFEPQCPSPIAYSTWYSPAVSLCSYEQDSIPDSMETVFTRSREMSPMSMTHGKNPPPFNCALPSSSKKNVFPAETRQHHSTLWTSCCCCTSLF
jgi:hypothetical protein